MSIVTKIVNIDVQWSAFILIQRRRLNSINVLVSKKLFFNLKVYKQTKRSCQLTASNCFNV